MMHCEFEMFGFLQLGDVIRIGGWDWRVTNFRNGRYVVCKDELDVWLWVKFLKLLRLRHWDFTPIPDPPPRNRF